MLLVCIYSENVSIRHQTQIFWEGVNASAKYPARAGIDFDPGKTGCFDKNANAQTVGVRLKHDSAKTVKNQTSLSGLAT
jgi:hypothetical protein